MHVIEVRNVRQALPDGLALLKQYGVKEESRAGPVLVAPWPVTTVYTHSWERVLLSPVRDANPFFHLFEALWMLAGRHDARWLDQFVSDFSSRFAEPSGEQHGAYGFRWRRHFDLEGGGHPNLPDQLETVIRMLRDNPSDRRAVIAMWDPVSDLGADKKDVPCNTHVYLRRRKRTDGPGDVLDMTVCCRSNDVVWGAYGANAVHFSILQEYLARRIGVMMGTYTQVSNNYHVYLSVLEKMEGLDKYAELYNEYITTIVQDGSTFDSDLKAFMERRSMSYSHSNPFFLKVAEPLYKANLLWKTKAREEAYRMLEGIDSDWVIAARQWMKRRMTKQ